MNKLSLTVLIVMLSELVWLGIMILIMVIKGAPFDFKDVTPIVILIGATIAFLSFIYTVKRNHSSDYLDKALQFFSESYEVISEKDDKGLPKNDRLNWLTSSRLLLTAQKMGSNITEESHKSIFIESREYWRARFYQLLNPSLEGFPEDYYSEKIEHMASSYNSNDRAPLSEKSLAVLYRFIQWPDEYNDPSYDIEYFTDDEIEKMRSFGPRNLGELLRKVRQYKEQIKVNETN